MELRHSMQDRKKVVAVVKISTDGQMVAAGAYGGRVAVWSLGGEPIAAWQTPFKNLAGLAFSPDNRHLATSGLGDTIVLWELPGGKAVGELSGHQTAVLGLRFIHSGQRLVSVGYDQTIRFWDARTWQPERSLPAPGVGLRGLAFSPDEKVVAVSLESLVQLRRVEDWEPLADLPISTKVVNGMAFTPDGRMLAIGGADKKIRVWDIS